MRTFAHQQLYEIGFVSLAGLKRETAGAGKGKLHF